MVYCCVPFCKSDSKKQPKMKQTNSKTQTYVTFHEFPCDNDLRSAWLRSICRKDFYPGDRAVVCSLHFKNDDFVLNLKLRKLKPKAVPSVFPGYPSWHKEVYLPKVVREKSRTPPKRQKLGESSSSMLPKCQQRRNIPSADLKTLPEQTICAELNESNLEPVNFSSQTKIEMSLHELYQENGKLKNLLCTQNKQIESLKEKVAIINDKLESYEKNSCLPSVEKMNVLDCEVSGNTENSKNESQKTLFPTSGTNNICVDEAGLKTILDTQIEQSDVDHAEIRRNQSCSNTAMSEITLQISDVQGRTSPNPEVNHQYTTSNLAVKEKADDVKQLQSATENFFLITEEPKQVVELKTCNSKKDEFDLYAEMLANKLRNMDEQFRKEFTNQIDKMISKKETEHFEGQQDPENCGTGSFP